ncbi:spindle and centriole-associated protein 1 isoform 2-T2 [Anomaloglossus baeobatrachus]|uniref:spindle and centriole-associated protein 1 isoform X2 n=1 Tax=Anomaloglossus baeobatrachus TaxID=238106 RepID=UPI003F5084F1
MSGRCPRPLSGWSGVKKSAGSRKKTLVRQAWDSSIQDLGVHRATPEELVQRHEIHKSRNHSLAQWELRKKSLRKEWRRQNGGTPDPLEDRRLALMMEILSDQYQMKDVLERSDRAMAVVKDLFGDAPRRHTGFPHVTMAPSCDLETSCGPITLKKDPPTRLSILSESIMDPQALNEVEEMRPEDSDDEDAEVSFSFQPGLDTEKVRRILTEESSHLTSDQWSGDNVQDPFITPKGADHPPKNHIALNATAAVNKVKTRLTEEEPQEAETSIVIGRILNPQPPNQRKLQRKGKKTRPPPGPPAPAAHEPSSLDVLKQMIQEVERELETYEQESGRAVPSAPQSQGLTGFTLSLVSAIRRLVSYLKESDRQLRQESVERQRLKDELTEQRLLIDALTAEILAMKDGGSASPSSHWPVSDQSPTTGEATIRRPAPVQEQTKASTNDASAHPLTAHPLSAHPLSAHPLSAHPLSAPGFHHGAERGDSAAPHPEYGVSSTKQVPTSHGDAGSLLDFEPAIMLSPPRQRTWAETGDQKSLLLSDHEVFSSSDAPYIRRRISPSRGQDFPRGDALVGHPHTEHQVPVRERTSAPLTNDHDIASRMAELTCQNNALKAQLAQFSGRTDSVDASHVAAQNKEAPSAHGAGTLEMRIAELNRQSAAARDKLLQLIEQQKQSLVVSPAISPITPQAESGRRALLIDAAPPMPHFTDSSPENTLSIGSGRRSGASQRSSSSVTGSSRGGRAASDASWMKVGKDKEEGWFALSAHVS